MNFNHAECSSVLSVSQALTSSRAENPLPSFVRQLSLLLLQCFVKNSVAYRTVEDYCYCAVCLFCCSSQLSRGHRIRYRQRLRILRCSSSILKCGRSTRELQLVLPRPHPCLPTMHLHLQLVHLQAVVQQLVCINLLR